MKSAKILFLILLNLGFLNCYSQNLIETRCDVFYTSIRNQVIINSTDKNLELLTNSGVVKKTKWLGDKIKDDGMVFNVWLTTVGEVELFVVKKGKWNSSTLEIKKIKVENFPVPVCATTTYSQKLNSRVRVKFPNPFCYDPWCDVISISYLGKKYKGDNIKAKHLRDMKPGENLNLQINYRRTGSKVQETMLTTLIIQE
jgi:hypothetical protein